jgi:ABC transport system ATP-binding/permease protein
MALITIRELTVGFHRPPLLEGVSCQIEAGQRIGLLGRNGSGKTTLLRILTGEVEPQCGEIIMAPGTKLSLLPQDIPQHLRGTVSEVVAQGFTQKVGCNNQDEYESAWQSERHIEQILSRMNLDSAAQFELLSSGMKRRVLLAGAIVSRPDLLLLDEPTNHLDIDAIGWLEDFLAHWNTTFIFVTHDRMFLRKLATRVLEIDRGRLFDWSCDYDTFLLRKDAALAAEETENALFDKKLAQEEAWIRTGIRARRTRNEGRVRALEQMRQLRSERRTAPGSVRIAIQQGRRSGALVAEVDGISFAYGNRPVVHDFSTTLMRGDKVGIIGPNGAGKTTLLRILLGQLQQQQGIVRLGTDLEIVYFDQLREQLNDDKTVQENVGEGSDSVRAGQQTRQLIGYLQDFLFSPARARTLVRFLSGGERNRVLLARLFAKPANVIVLDEPTNDLDTETLELLEERLVQFEGTVLLVSHDRTFLNNVVTSTIVFEHGYIKEYVGGYDAWIRQRANRGTEPGNLSQRVVEKSPAPRSAETGSRGVDPSDRQGHHRKRRLTYNEQQVLAALPAMIEQLDAEISALHKAMSDVSFYQQSGDQIAREQMRLKDLEVQVAAAYKRWESLELQ